MTAPKHLRPVAVLKSPRLNLLLLAFAKSILLAMTGNPNFPNASLGPLEAAIEALNASQTTAASRAIGSAQVRDGDRQEVINALQHLRDHVQGVADQQTNTADAISVIVSAGMRVRKASKRSKQELAVKNSERSGEVLLVAQAVGHSAVYYWEYSLDELVWVPVPETMQASTTIKGLVRGQLYAFRVRMRTRKGPTGYTQVVTLTVT